MRILIVSHACATPANQRLFKFAAERRGWDVTMLIPRLWKSEYGRTLVPSRLEGFSARLETARVFMSGSIPLHVYARSIGKLLNKLDPDVIYVHNEPYALSTLQCVLANQMTLRRPIGFYSAQNIAKRYPIGFRHAEQFVYRHCQYAMPITPDVGGVLRSKGYSGSTQTISVGFDGDAYRCEPRAARQRQLDRAGQPLSVGYIGRFVEEKGLSTLFDAVALMQNSAKLRMIGGGPMESALREKAKILGIEGRIEWAGFSTQDQMPRIYQALDLLVLPSETRTNWKEQFGRVLVEAMASGTPVVGSNSGEIPNVIAECGGGIVFPEGEAASLARLLDDLCEQSEVRADLAGKGAHGARVHSWDRVADRFADAIEAASNGGCASAVFRT